MIYTYEPGPMDVTLTQAWSEMMQDGSLKHLFYTPPTLSEFLAYVQPPRLVSFDIDEHHHAWFVAWTEAFFDSGMFSVWIRKDHRGFGEGSLHGREAFYAAACAAFTRFGNRLYGYTNQEHLFPMYQHLGYEIHCKLDNIWSGKDCWLMSLTKDALLRSRGAA